MNLSASTAPSDSASAAAPLERISESVIGVCIIFDGVENSDATDHTSLLQNSVVSREKYITL